MKIIHTADIHLGSRISGFPKEISDALKANIRNSLARMVDYAKRNTVKVILLAGDVFDSDKPFKKDKDYFYGVIKANPDIDFLYLRGNHDLAAEGEAEYPNLKLFSDEWTSYSYGDVTVNGIEMTDSNAASLYSTLSLEKSSLNIVMLHGSVSGSAGKDNVCLSRLRDKNIDYLALGHYHGYDCGAVDERGEYAYSGCPSGRGFDECGEKGFVVLDAVGGKISRSFVPFAGSGITEVSVNITAMPDLYSVYSRIENEVRFDREGIYRINLVGEADGEADSAADDVRGYFEGRARYIDVKDKTRKKIDIAAYEGDLSLRGEFVRTVYASENYSEEEKLEIIYSGLKALRGEKL